jgi:hypothetical protein
MNLSSPGLLSVPHKSPDVIYRIKNLVLTLTRQLCIHLCIRILKQIVYSIYSTYVNVLSLWDPRSTERGHGRRRCAGLQGSVLPRYGVGSRSFRGLELWFKRCQTLQERLALSKPGNHRYWVSVSIVGVVSRCQGSTFNVQREQAG